MRYKVWTSSDIGSITGDAFGGEAVKFAAQGGESIPKIALEGGESIAKITVQGGESVPDFAIVSLDEVAPTGASLYRFSYSSSEG